MKVRVDREICAGFGVCVALSPDLFKLHDDGYATVLFAEVPPELEDIARQAAVQCPSNAITVSD